MKRNIFFWQFAGFVFATALGTILHFLYDWVGENIAVAPFSAINESTWEHMKILFFPMLIFGLFQNRFFRADYPGFWCVKLLGTVVGLLVIPLLFYGYNGAIGKTPDAINVLIFFIGAALGAAVEWHLFTYAGKQCRWKPIAFLGFAALLFAFVFFTFAPPSLPIFQDPLA